MAQNVQRWANNFHDEERSGRFKLSIQILWKMELHNFRIFMCISTDFTHYSLLDYHSYSTISQEWFIKCPRVHEKRREWLRLWQSFTTKMIMNFSVTSYEYQVIKPGFHLGMVKPKNVQSSGLHKYSPKKARKILSKRFLPEWWWQLFSGTGNESWWWN
jgi:hypothetical protein